MDFLPGLVPPIAFFVLSVVAIIGALGVVILDRITHSALSLALSFLAVAGIYVLLQAEFMFAVQILVYVGAVMVLIVFAIMLTQDSQAKGSNGANKQMGAAALVSVLMLGALVWVLTGTTWSAGDAAPARDVTRLLGEALVNQYVLPFEIASVVLLAAMIGAIVIAREN